MDNLGLTPEYLTISYTWEYTNKVTSELYNIETTTFFTLIR